MYLFIMLHIYEEKARQVVWHRYWEGGGVIAFIASPPNIRT